MKSGLCSTCRIVLTPDNCNVASLKRGSGYCRACTKKYRRKRRSLDVVYKRKYNKEHAEEISKWREGYCSKPIPRHAQVKVQLKKDKVPSFDLLWNLRYYTEIIREGICHYCLGDLNPSSHALDRVNNDGPHACWNVVPCCRYCNKKKSNDTTYEEMMLLAPALREIRRRREATNVAATLCSMPPDS